MAVDKRFWVGALARLVGVFSGGVLLAMAVIVIAVGAVGYTVWYVADNCISIWPLFICTP